MFFNIILKFLSKNVDPSDFEIENIIINIHFGNSYCLHLYP